MEEGGTQPGGDASLQFDKVEPGLAQLGRVCRGCQQRIEHEYFELAGHVICAACAQRFSAARGWRAFLRAAGFGAGAALLGTLAWFAIIQLTHSEFGLLAIGVGLFVGVAVRKGSGGHGGLRYQVLAMALTYMSITASYVPIVVRELGRHSEEPASKAQNGAHSGAGAERAADTTATAPASHSPANLAAHSAAPAGAGTILLGLVFVLALAVASPFLAGFDNLMGWIIIGIALYEAWKINKSVPVRGPFRFAPAEAAPHAAPVP